MRHAHAVHFELGATGEVVELPPHRGVSAIEIELTLLHHVQVAVLLNLCADGGFGHAERFRECLLRAEGEQHSEYGHCKGYGEGRKAQCGPGLLQCIAARAGRIGCSRFFEDGVVLHCTSPCKLGVGRVSYQFAYTES